MPVHQEIIRSEIRACRLSATNSMALLFSVGDTSACGKCYQDADHRSPKPLQSNNESKPGASTNM